MRLSKSFLWSGALGLCLVLLLSFLSPKGPKHDHHPLIINDVSNLHPIRVDAVVRPQTLGEIQQALLSHPGPVTIGGARYSQGGQVALEKSLHIDMRGFNQILSHSDHEITVQPGITWREIQEFIDPLNLSVRTMQTYSNFTVGGSLSVNAHGRYNGHGPLIESVKSLRVLLASGEIVSASPFINESLFYGVIGGYGGLGIIVEATLKLDDNVKIERRTQKMHISEYRDYFLKNIRGKQNVVFHNADIYPPHYQEVLDVSWYTTDKPLTNPQRLIAPDRSYFWEPKLVGLIGASRFGKWIREHVMDPLYYSKKRVVWRNWEASYDVAEIEPPSREKETYLLREYFVPIGSFDAFYPKMRRIFNEHQVNVLNVSIRHATEDPGSLLAWAKTEVFAFVVYFKQDTTAKAAQQAQIWDRKLIDLVIKEGGSYYLPYELNATYDQFLKCYPKAIQLFELKKKRDPANRFTNSFWAHYFPKKDTLKKNAHF